MERDRKSPAELREEIEGRLSAISTALSLFEHPGWKEVADYVRRWKRQQEAILLNPYLESPVARERACMEVYVLEKLLALPETYAKQRKDLERALAAAETPAPPRPLRDRLFSFIR